MTRDDLKYIPHNFAELKNAEIISQHKSLLKNNSYTAARDLLNRNPQVEGFRASTFNIVEQKILYVEEQLQHKTKIENILYQDTEPSDEDMEGKVIWSCSYN